MNVERLARTYEFSVCTVLLGFVGLCTSYYLLLAAVPFHLYFFSRMGRILGINRFALIGLLLLMLCPFINTLGLLLLNRKAAKVLIAAGWVVGVMGFRIEPVKKA